MSLILSLGTTAVTYVYPFYATYKALMATSHMAIPTAQNEKPVEKPTELSELETWTMYWCVISLFWAIDTWLGWTFRWYVIFLTDRVVLYAHAKFLFACWLALPQTRVCIGSNNREPRCCTNRMWNHL